MAQNSGAITRIQRHRVRSWILSGLLPSCAQGPADPAGRAPWPFQITVPAP